jgi:hypothetical protein
MSPCRILGLVVLACGLAVLPPGAGAADTAEDPIVNDEAALKRAGLATDGEALVRFFRRRSPTEADLAKLRATIKKLGDDSFEVREKASADLIAAGRVAIPLLKEALQSDDLEIARRARDCLARQEADDVALVLAAARLIGAKKPAGAVDALLGYAPFAEEEVVEDEVLAALAAVGLGKDGKAAEALVKALADKAPARRAAAAFVAARSKDAKQRAAAKERLKDAAPQVRWRAAQGLLAAKDKSALPALIALLTEAPAATAWRAEGLLYRLAGDKAPATNAASDSDAERKKARAAWEAWYKAEGGKLDLAKLDVEIRVAGLTLLVLPGYEAGKGRVFEIDHQGRERWSVDNLEGPVDAHLLRRDRVLIAEDHGRRITERDLKGNILWEHKVDVSPVNCCRLPNGNTWIVTYNRILEVTAGEKVVLSLGVKRGLIDHAVRLRNGHIAYMNYTGDLVEIDAKGNEVRSLKVDRVRAGLAKFEALANGNFLVPQQVRGKVEELTPEGKVVWSCAMANVSSATRLPNGNTLLTSYQDRKVVEVNRAGKVVWQKAPGAGLLNASRR